MKMPITMRRVVAVALLPHEATTAAKNEEPHEYQQDHDNHGDDEHADHGDDDDHGEHHRSEHEDPR